VADDPELFGRLQQGDSEARATVFALYSPMVRRLLARILRDDSDVADALQDTFVKVFRSAPQVREHQALRPWVLRVAESIGLDEARRRQRHRSRTADDLGAHEPSIGCPSFEARTALRDAFRLLSVLPKEEQRVLTLRRIDGLELTKIADACDVSLATIKRRLARASNRFEALARRQPSLSSWVRTE
jgi:RNA polymerase sigma-70 factor (ECF subfamily)